MKAKFKYEAPLLVDLSVESVKAGSCETGNEISFICVEGSCAPMSDCYAGQGAQKCTTGSLAHDWSGNTNCAGCCQTGTSNSPTHTCWCNPGYGAAWTCTYGGMDGQNCFTGGNVGNCTW